MVQIREKITNLGRLSNNMCIFDGLKHKGFLVVFF